MLLLPFTSSLIPSILDGSKTSTYRFGLKYDHLQIGETIDIVDSDTNEIVAQAKIQDKQQLLFAELPLQSDNHQSFTSREEMRKEFETHYAYIGRSIRDDDIFLVIGFELNG